jgi:YfiH family protein
VEPRLTRYDSRGVTLLGDPGRPCGVTFAFTERGGGVSEGSYASLNLGPRTADDPASVTENRRRALLAVGVPVGLQARLVSPHQVHGSQIVEVADASSETLDRAHEACEAGADAVVCCAEDVPVMLVVADCLPVVLVAPGGFAVIHSGWHGTVREISGRALESLCAMAGCEAGEVLAYIGPHVTGEDYEVSCDLQRRFICRFGLAVARPHRHLDLAAAVTATLLGRGVPRDRILDSGASTMRHTDRYFSYRAEGAKTGRIGAIAWMPSDRKGNKATEGFEGSVSHE